MAVELDRAQVAVAVGPGLTERAANERAPELRIDSVAAQILRSRLARAVGRRELARAHEPDEPLAVERAASQRRDHVASPVRRGLRVRRVAPAEHGLGVFDHRVLEAAAGAQERHTVLARVADRAERPGQAPVRAAGHAPEAVERRDALRARGFLARHPLVLDGELALFTGPLQRDRYRAVRDDGLAAVADEADAHRAQFIFLAAHRRRPAPPARRR